MSASAEAGSGRVDGGRLLPLLLLGLCPAIAVSDSVMDALWMCVGVMVVSVLSSLARLALERSSARPETAVAPGSPSALLRALLVSSLLAAGFQAGLLAISPAASASLGIYAPLIAVNVLVVGQAGGVPVPIRRVLAVACGRGAAFGAALLGMALVREVLGAGTITLFPIGTFRGTIVIGPLADEPVRALGLAGGALLVMGYLAGALRAITGRERPGRSDGERPE